MLSVDVGCTGLRIEGGVAQRPLISSKMLSQPWPFRNIKRSDEPVTAKSIRDAQLYKNLKISSFQYSKHSSLAQLALN